MLSFALLVCMLCAVYLRFKYGRGKSRSLLLPPAAPGELPVIGHTYQIFKNISNLWEFFTCVAENCAKQGGVTYFRFGSKLYYVITDPQDALIAANACIEKHYAYDFVKPWVGDGLVISSVIVNSEDALTAGNVCLIKHYIFHLYRVWLGDGLLISSGEIWKRHRKLLTPAFSLPVTYTFLDVFNSQFKKLASSMEPHVGKGIFDHYPYLKNNALETLCVGTFGISAIDDKDFTQKYMKSVNEMINIGISRAVKFWLQNDFIYWLSGLKKKEEEVLENLHAMSNAILQKKKATMKHEALNTDTEFQTTGTRYKPFLDLLLELSKNGALTEREIKEEMDSIIVAGFETTSNQLTYTLLLLGAHPEVQEKLFEELLEVLGPDRDVEKDDVNKLVYTNAVLMESLRMFPSFPLLLRYVDKDVRLKKYTMRAGSYCVIFPLTSYHDQTWGAHTDQFQPERWLDGDFRNNKDFAAFGLGKRACLGRTYAMISMKVTLAHLLRQYRVKADLSKLKEKYEMLMRPVSGHEISIERRT